MRRPRPDACLVGNCIGSTRSKLGNRGRRLELRDVVDLSDGDVGWPLVSEDEVEVAGEVTVELLADLAKDFNVSWLVSEPPLGLSFCRPMTPTKFFVDTRRTSELKQCHAKKGSLRTYRSRRKIL